MFLMKKFISAFCSLILIISGTLLNGCANSKYSRTFYYFNNTPIDIVIYGKDFDEELENQIEKTLSDLDSDFSISNENSLINAINSQDFSSQTLVDEYAEIFSKCKTLYSFTGGKFNPAVYPLVKLWQFSPSFPVNDFTPPKQDVIDEVLNSNIVDFDNFKLNDDNSLTKLNPYSSIDLGGIIKGYGADKIADVLTSYGIEKGYVNVGSSSIKTIKIGSLAIRHPENTSQNIVKINLDSNSDFSISTSGDYERFYEFDGIRYSHIIDSETGKPNQNGIISATIITSHGIDADALSTALCLCDFDDSQSTDELRTFITALLSNPDYQNAKIYAIYNKNGKKYLITNQKQGKNFTLLDDSYLVFNF